MEMKTVKLQVDDWAIIELLILRAIPQYLENESIQSAAITTQILIDLREQLNSQSNG